MRECGRAVVRSGAVRGRSGRLKPLVAAALAGAMTACLLALCGNAADAAERSRALQRRSGVLDRRAHTALLELYALEASLGRARARAAALAARSEELSRRTASAVRRTGIVRRSIAVTRARTANVLQRLYVEGEPDPIALVLGAASLDEAIAGLDGLERAAHRNRQLASDLRSGLGRLRTLEASLRAQRIALDAARRSASEAVQALQRSVDARAAFIGRLRRRSTIAQAQAVELERQARAAAQKTDALVAERVPESAIPTQNLEPGPITGPRTLTVDAVAYHLPGRTASGLTVGHGVVAVDPGVIPLGTRLYVPGYGAAVAADVGSAVRGLLIDLWFPSKQQALAWGRRTVTITVYG
jgi:3D (Asp-Asp-Asp) domain-containing protein